MLVWPTESDDTGVIDNEFLDLTDSDELLTDDNYTTDEDTEDTIDLTEYYDEQEELSQEEEGTTSISEDTLPCSKRHNPG